MKLYNPHLMRLPESPLSLGRKIARASRGIEVLGSEDGLAPNQKAEFAALRRQRRSALLKLMAELAVSLGIAIPSGAVLVKHFTGDGQSKKSAPMELLYQPGADIDGKPNVYDNKCPQNDRVDTKFLQDNGKIDLSAEELKHPENQKLAKDIEALNVFVNAFLQSTQPPHNCADNIYFGYRKNGKPHLRSGDDKPYPAPLPKGQFHCDSLANAPDVLCWYKENNVPYFYRPTNTLFIPNAYALVKPLQRANAVNGDLVPAAYTMAAALIAMHDAVALSAHPRDDVFSDIKLFIAIKELSSFFEQTRLMFRETRSHPNLTVSESIKGILLGIATSGVVPQEMRNLMVYVTTRFFLTLVSTTPVEAGQLQQIATAPERTIDGVLTEKK